MLSDLHPGNRDIWLLSGVIRLSRCVCLVVSALLGGASPWDDGLAEPEAEVSQFLELLLVEIRIALRHVFDGIVHPLFLLVLGCSDDFAAVDMTEEFVSGPIEGRLTSSSTSQYLLLLGCEWAGSDWGSSHCISVVEFVCQAI